MQINDKMLEKLEKLSALKIPQENRNEFKNQLEKIVNFVDILNELNLDAIEVDIINEKTPLREDIPYQSNVINTVLKHAPKTHNKYFEVPKIIE